MEANEKAVTLKLQSFDESFKMLKKFSSDFEALDLQMFEMSSKVEKCVADLETMQTDIKTTIESAVSN